MAATQLRTTAIRSYRVYLRDATDEIDKPFKRDLLCWGGTGDRAAKSWDRGCKPDHVAFSVVPHLRRPCAASHCRGAAIC